MTEAACLSVVNKASYELFISQAVTCAWITCLAGLQIRYASHSFNQWLDPKKEAPSVEGASLVSATPPSGRHRGGVLVG